MVQNPKSSFPCVASLKLVYRRNEVKGKCSSKSSAKESKSSTSESDPPNRQIESNSFPSNVSSLSGLA